LAVTVGEITRTVAGDLGRSARAVLAHEQLPHVGTPHILGAVNPGASDEQLSEVEEALGIMLPAGLRSFLSETNGLDATESGVRLHGTDDITALNLHGDGVHDSHPGLLVVGSDGSREQVGLDLRTPEPPVVLVDITSEGWNSGYLQASRFSEFLDHVRRGGGLSWSTPYLPDR
jgi:hypothetical protein